MTDEDAPVEVDFAHGFRTTAECMRALTKATGRTLTELFQESDDEADRLQAWAFVELHNRYRRAGHLPEAGELWERAGLVELVMAPTPTFDPFVTDSSPTSLPSAVTGA
jgi:hypothetical protein